MTFVLTRLKASSELWLRFFLIPVYHEADPIRLTLNRTLLVRLWSTIYVGDAHGWARSPGRAGHLRVRLPLPL